MSTALLYSSIAFARSPDLSRASASSRCRFLDACLVCSVAAFAGSGAPSRTRTGSTPKFRILSS
eukprot:scaffold94453_cov33-Tisochrysis_lutea.AAC.2